MPSVEKDLAEIITDGLIEGKEFNELSTEVGLPLEEVIAIAHGLHDEEFPKNGKFTEGQSEYLRDCIKYGVSYKAIGRMLGVDVKHDASHSGKVDTKQEETTLQKAIQLRDEMGLTSSALHNKRFSVSHKTYLQACIARQIPSDDAALATGIDRERVRAYYHSRLMPGNPLISQEQELGCYGDFREAAAVFGNLYDLFGADNDMAHMQKRMTDLARTVDRKANTLKKSKIPGKIVAELDERAKPAREYLSSLVRKQ